MWHCGGSTEISGLLRVARSPGDPRRPRGAFAFAFASDFAAAFAAGVAAFAFGNLRRSQPARPVAHVEPDATRAKTPKCGGCNEMIKFQINSNIRFSTQYQWRRPFTTSLFHAAGIASCP